MKTILLLSILFASTAVHAQSVLRVNNTPGSAAPYTTIAAAVTAAGVNDIIMVEGSLTSYGSIIVDKKVNMIGPGYLLAQNPGLQATPFPATFATITLNSGASGSSFSGLSFSNTINFQINSAGNISITSCYFEGCNGSGGGGINVDGAASNLIIRGNYFTQGCYGINISGSYSGVIITNNVLREISTGSSSICLITHNIFNANPTLQNSLISNNIFRGSTINNVTGSTIKNNIFFSSSQAGADATNFFNGTDGSVFAAGSTLESYWRLKTGSPAIGFGEGSTDCGIYGGTTPYRPSGIAASQPTIIDYSLPTTIPKNGVLNVKVSAKVN